MRELEDAAFAELDVRRPRDTPFDLAVKGLLAAAVLFLGLYGLRSELVDPADHLEFAAFAAGACIRIGWLGRASVECGSGLAWLAVPIALLVGGGVLARPYAESELALPGDRSLATTLSLQHDLSGADLRGRDLTNFYLYGKDLRHADLSAATLDGAVLEHAHLNGANLSRANLEDADFAYADFRAADLSGATLFGAFRSRARSSSDSGVRDSTTDTPASASKAIAGLACFGRARAPASSQRDSAARSDGRLAHHMS